VDQGGEPHTFTEVKHFGGGFIPGLNAPEEDTVPECAGGFSNVRWQGLESFKQHCSDQGSVARQTPFSVLHSSLDARESRGEVTCRTRKIEVKL
jgi:hypothetical protein